MSVHNSVSASLCAILALTAGLLQAQSPEARDAWLMKNYRFTGPPATGSIKPVDPVVSELRQIQNALLSIMRKADFAEDYETALAAADQATATAQLLGTITKRLETAAKTSDGDPNANASTPLYALAFKDRTIELATCYWTDGLMFHYMTRQGAHVQVRLDLLDRDLTRKLNRGTNLDFRLPD
jgi:hypothetical protein